MEKQVFTFLWYLSNMECFREVADCFGMSKNCSFNVFYRICHKLLALKRRLGVIAFPQGQRALNTIAEFERLNGFPGIRRAIDGTHIRIEKPHHGNSYINRKGYASVLLQGVCDSRKQFLDAYAGEPGSIHDYRLFTKSDLYSRIRQNDVQFENNSHLLGDLAYKLSTILMVGFKDNGNLNDSQRLFNKLLDENRVIIENAFALLKGRFRRLKMLETKRMDFIPLIIVSACIMHNICLMNEDHMNEMLVDDIDDEQNAYKENDVEAAAIAKRENIKNVLYIRNLENNQL